MEVDPAFPPERLLRGEDDLARVIAHVLDGVEERAEAVDAPALDPSRRGERVVVERADDRATPAHDGVQALDELAPGGGAVGRELERPPARVGFAPESREHPLREVAAEMKDEVAHAVDAPVGPGPHLGLVEAVHAEADLPEVLVEIRVAYPPHATAVQAHRPRP
jgi:hypothetical protein